MDFIYFLFVGLLAGWVAGKITKGSGHGLIVNLVVGVFGAMVGRPIFHKLGLGPTGFIGDLVVASIGAIFFLFVVGLIFGRRRR